MEAHAHPHSHNQASLGKAFGWGVALNLGYCAFEAAAGLYVGSLALLSDAGHNLSDVVTLVLAMVGFRLAKWKPTPHYTYGFGKGTVLISLFNALLLLVAMGAITYGAIERLANPQVLLGGSIAWVAGLGIVVNLGSAFLFFKHQDAELNARGAFLHLLADAGISAAVVVAGLVMRFYTIPWLDPAVSLFVVLIVVWGTWGLLRDSLRLSLDGVPHTMDVARLEETIRQVKGVAGVHHLHVWPLSTTEAGLTAHILTQPAEMERMEQIKAAIKHLLEHEGISHSTLEFELPGEHCHDQGHVVEVKVDMHAGHGH